MIVQDLTLDDVHVPAQRLRDFDPAWAEALAHGIGAQGLLNPILVRPRPRGGWRLVAGRYRLEAVRSLGWPTVPAMIFEGTSDVEAVEAEAYENLNRADLIALDRCRALAHLKEVYETLHPEAKRGGDRRSSAARQLAADRLAAARAAPKQRVDSLIGEEDGLARGFAMQAAPLFCMSVPAIMLCVRIWRKLTPASRRRLPGTPLAANQSELKLLSEQTAQRQSDALDLILDSEHPANSVAAALDCLDGAGDMTSQERAFQAYVERFARLSEPELDHLLVVNEATVIASLRRRGRI